MDPGIGAGDCTGPHWSSDPSISSGTVAPPPPPGVKILLKKEESWQVDLGRKEWEAEGAVFLPGFSGVSVTTNYSSAVEPSSLFWVSERRPWVVRSEFQKDVWEGPGTRKRAGKRLRECGEQSSLEFWVDASFWKAERHTSISGVFHTHVALWTNQPLHFGDGTRLSVVGKVQDRGVQPVSLGPGLAFSLPSPVEGN